MNSTSFGSRLVRIAARSPGRSSTGPEVWRRLTPISRAMMCASVVLPRPGGPNSSTWSSASPRPRAAWMKISSWPRIFSWPTYSASVAGRSVRSICSSCTEEGLAEMSRSVSTATSGFCQSLQCGADALGDRQSRRQALDRRERFLLAVTEAEQGVEDVARRTPDAGVDSAAYRQAFPSARAAAVRPSSCRSREPWSGAPCPAAPPPARARRPTGRTAPTSAVRAPTPEIRISLRKARALRACAKP